MRLFFTELKKIKRRHIGLLYLAALFLTFIWMYWAMDDMGDVITLQGYYYLLLSIPLINAILLPTIVAAAESRLCDMEIKGNTLKLLCTMETRESIYHVKILLGSLYLLLFSLAETLMIPLLGLIFSIRQPFPVCQTVIFFLSTFLVSLVLLLIQQPLSLLSGNQLFPLFLGVGGTFAGLFSWFFPTLPLRYFLPWGYYCVGTTINYIYEEATRAITYYTIPFPALYFGIFLVFGLFVYIAGKRAFTKKEV